MIEKMVYREEMLLFIEPEKETGDASSSPATGIPDFWLTSLKNTDIFADWVKVYSEY